jgi:hypothetical protein
MDVDMGDAARPTLIVASLLVLALSRDLPLEASVDDVALLMGLVAVSMRFSEDPRRHKRLYRSRMGLSW